MISFGDDRPDMWGNKPNSPMFGTPPDDDPYWKDCMHPHFNSEVYWAKREAEFWRDMADAFWYSWTNGDDDIMEAVGERATPYFEENDDE